MDRQAELANQEHGAAVAVHGHDGGAMAAIIDLTDLRLVAAVTAAIVDGAIW